MVYNLHIMSREQLEIFDRTVLEYGVVSGRAYYSQLNQPNKPKGQKYTYAYICKLLFFIKAKMDLVFLRKYVLRVSKVN